MKANRFLVVISFFLLCGCVYGPKVEHKGPLDVLSGDNYEGDGLVQNAVFAPMAKRKERLTRIEGRLVYDQNGLDVPLKFTTLVLSASGGEVEQKMSTDLNGKFVFSGVFHNGTYVVKVDSEKWRGEKKLGVDSYLIEDVVIRALPK